MSFLRAVFVGIAIVAGSSCSDEREVIYIGPERRECIGTFVQQCYLVRRGGADDWEYFYDTIEGFEYEPGYLWTLLVRKSPVENPAADASSVRWRLIRILDKRPAG